MIISSVEVFNQVNIIDVDNGTVHPLKPGSYSLITEGKQGTTWKYLLISQDPNLGAVFRWWIDEENKGNLKLIRKSEDNDPTIDGAKLPITASSQLTDYQKKFVRCGWLI